MPFDRGGSEKPSDGSDPVREPSEPVVAGGRGPDVSARLFSGAAFSFVSLVVGSAFLFVLHVLIARVFGADVLGVYSIAVGIMSVAVAAGLLGLEMGMLKVLPPSVQSPGGPGSVRRLVQLVLAVVTLTTTTLGIALTAAAPWLIQGFQVPEFRVFFTFVFLALPLLAINTLGFAMFRALSWFPAEAAINGVLSRALRPALLGLLVWMGFAGEDPSRILLAMVFVAEAVTVAIVIWILLSRLRPVRASSLGTALDRLRSTLRFSVPVMPAMTIQAGLQHADLLVIGFLATAADTGVFRAASLVALTLGLIMRSFGAAFAPMISEDHAAGRVEALRRRYRGVAFLIFAASLPAFFLLAVNRVWIMNLFGAEFVALGSIVLVILGAGQLVNAVTGQVGYMLLLTGSRNAYVWTAFLGVGSMLAFTAVGYVIGGVFGAAAGSAVAIGGVNLVRTAVVQHRLQTHPFSRRQLGMAATGLSLTGVAVGLESWLEPAAWLTLALSIAFVLPFVIPLSFRITRAVRSGSEPW